jgi:hypothetical protein
LRLFSIHNLGLVGHIEDIAVAKDQQGKKLGLRIIQALDYVAEQVGCYKVCIKAIVVVQNRYKNLSMLIEICSPSSTAQKPTKAFT